MLATISLLASCGGGTGVGSPTSCAESSHYSGHELVDLVVRLDPSSVDDLGAFVDYISDGPDAPGRADGNGAIQTMVPDYERHLVFIKYECESTSASRDEAVRYIRRWPSVSGIEHDVTPNHAFR